MKFQSIDHRRLEKLHILCEWPTLCVCRFHHISIEIQFRILLPERFLVQSTLSISLSPSESWVWTTSLDATRCTCSKRWDFCCGRMHVLLHRHQKPSTVKIYSMSVKRCVLLMAHSSALLYVQRTKTDTPAPRSMFFAWPQQRAYERIEPPRRLICTPIRPSSIPAMGSKRQRARTRTKLVRT